MFNACAVVVTTDEHIQQRVHLSRLKRICDFLFNVPVTKTTPVEVMVIYDTTCPKRVRFISHERVLDILKGYVCIARSTDGSITQVELGAEPGSVILATRAEVIPTLEDIAWSGLPTSPTPPLMQQVPLSYLCYIPFCNTYVIQHKSGGFSFETCVFSVATTTQLSEPRAITIDCRNLIACNSFAKVQRKIRKKSRGSRKLFSQEAVWYCELDAFHSLVRLRWLGSRTDINTWAVYLKPK